MIDQGGFSGARFAGQKHQAFAIFYAVGQFVQRPADLGCQIKIGRVGIYVKRVFLQSEKALIHRGSPETRLTRQGTVGRSIVEHTLSHTPREEGSRDFPVGWRFKVNLPGGITHRFALKMRLIVR
jgi:hypothetical protein